MAFKAFDFPFNPPQTVPVPAPESVPAGPSGPTVGGPTSGAQSRAGQLIAKLNNLTVFSQYLQTAIVARTGKIAIEIEPVIDPSTARALCSIYGVDTPPNFITVPMYNQLLDVHIGALQLEMAVGLASTIQANPFQVADVTTVVSTVNAHLVQSPSYNNWLPLQLASLKGDAVVFQSQVAALATYPAYYASTPLVPEDYTPSLIQASTLDVSDDLFAYQNDALDQMGAAYAAIYQSLASASAVENDIGSVMVQYFAQPIANMIRIVGLLTSLIGLIHKPSMEEIQGDLISYSFVRLMSESASMLAAADQMIHLAVAPLETGLASAGLIVAAARQQASKGGITLGGVLPGLSNSSGCVATPGASASATLPVPGLGDVTAGLKALGETMDWAMRTTRNGMSLIDKSCRQLTNRRIKAQVDLNSLMCSIKTVMALVNLASAVVSEFQKGTLTSNPSAQQQQDATSRILTSLQTGTNTTFVASGSQVVVNSPDMPPAPPAVVTVLQASKIRTTLGAISA